MRLPLPVAVSQCPDGAVHEGGGRGRQQARLGHYALAGAAGHLARVNLETRLSYIMTLCEMTQLHHDTL